MTQPPRRFLLIASLAAATFFLAGFAPAQDKKAEIAKQKEEVVANLKKADFSKKTIVESDNFFLAGTMADDKAKALSTALEKVVPIARKGLQYESKDEVWKGKLAVYYLPDARDFKTFMRAVVLLRPEGVYFDVRSDNPFVVDPVETTGKATEADLTANAAATVAEAYIRAKGATAELPFWLTNGFGRATALRAEGLTSKRYLAFKAQSKSLASGGKTGSPAEIAPLWGESKIENSDVLSASLVEYMAYGPGAENFIKFIYGFRPDENGNVPSAAQAFEAAGWKEVPKLEMAWRKWAATGKP